MMRYVNVPLTIGAVLSARMATLHELQTVLGMGDLYDMLEVISIDNFNLLQAQKNG